MIYCVVPQELAEALYDKMVEYYRDNPNVTVVVDRRGGADRRTGSDGGGKRVVRDRRRTRPSGSFPPIFPPSDPPEVA